MGLRFIVEFLKHPLQTGAVAPSSRGMARAMVAGLDLPNANVAVEYGPGTGAFTGLVLEQLAGDATFFAIEKNAAMAAAFNARYPQVKLFEDSVANVGQHLRSLGRDTVDAIVCGLPWASFTGELQDSLLEATHAVLRDGGRFATFAYLQGLLLPSGRALKRKLRDSFSTVTTSPTFWLNMPPAFVYRCVK